MTSKHSIIFFEENGVSLAGYGALDFGFE